MNDDAGTHQSSKQQGSQRGGGKRFDLGRGRPI